MMFVVVAETPAFIVFKVPYAIRTPSPVHTMFSTEIIPAGFDKVIYTFLYKFNDFSFSFNLNTPFYKLLMANTSHGQIPKIAKAISGNIMNSIVTFDNIPVLRLPFPYLLFLNVSRCLSICLTK